MIEKPNSCYNCRYCIREVHEYETWCHETSKVINNSFGEGDSEPCKQYVPAGKLYAFSYAFDYDEPLPF